MHKRPHDESINNLNRLRELWSSRVAIIIFSGVLVSSFMFERRASCCTALLCLKTLHVRGKQSCFRHVFSVDLCFIWDHHVCPLVPMIFFLQTVPRRQFSPCAQCGEETVDSASWSFDGRAFSTRQLLLGHCLHLRVYIFEEPSHSTPL